ncbi:MAG: nucleotidyltransferase domain-containing protein, partial [Patescibacteria group bacterium]
MIRERFRESIAAYKYNETRKKLIQRHTQEVQRRLIVYEDVNLSETEKRFYIAKHAASILAEADPHINQIFCFGSVSRDQARESSDTDLACITDYEPINTNYYL